MDLLCFETYEDMACDVFGVLYEVTKEDEFNDIAIIAKYEEARQIIKELLCIGCEIKSIDLHDAEYDRYDAEYIISVVMNEEDKECEIWCEPMLRENGYIMDESSVFYVFDNCSSKVVPYCKGEIIYEVSIGDECFKDYDEYACANCDICGCVNCYDVMKHSKEEKYVEYSKDGNGDMHGFTVSKNDGNTYCSYSVYTTEKMESDFIKSLLKEIGF